MEVRFVRLFFSRLLESVEQDLITVDPMQHLIPFAQLPLGLMEYVERQPDGQPPLDRFVGWKPGQEHFPRNPRNPYAQQGLKTSVIALGRGTHRSQRSGIHIELSRNNIHPTILEL